MTKNMQSAVAETPSLARRKLLAAVALTPALAAVPALASAPLADRRAWDAATAALDKIKAADAAFTPGWWDAWQKCKAECDAVPHVEFGPSAHFGPRKFSTADTMEVRRARREVADLDSGRMRLDDIADLREGYEMKRQLVVAAEKRNHQVQAIRTRYDMDRLDARAEELGDLIAEHRQRLMDIPAPDLPALRWKLDQLRDENGDIVQWSAEYVDQCFADVARLLGEA